MPDPAPSPDARPAQRAAWVIFFAGVVITVLKFGVFAMTDSVAVLSDAAESVVNIAAAVAVIVSLWVSNRPADRSHPYGHGKIEFFAIGLEGMLIFLAAVLIGYEAIARLIIGHQLQRLGLGILGVAGIAVLTVALASFVLVAGRRLDNSVLLADGKHLLTDAGSTIGVMFGLGLAALTGWAWLDPVVGLIIAGVILIAGWHLLKESFNGLMDRVDPEDQKTIVRILDHAIEHDQIRGYHKVRHRHTGPFHWVDMHLEVDGRMTIAQGHRLASEIEGRIERALGQANATAHLEPYPTDPADSAAPLPPGPSQRRPAVSPPIADDT